GSVDGTTEILRQFASHTRLPFRWQGVPGNRSQGRNAAIRLADTDLIAVTDVNIVEPEWFERIIAPLECGKADVVGGWYEPRAVVRCWTATSAVEAFRMYRRYAFSDGRAGTLGMPQTHYGRIYAVYGIAAGVLVLGFWWPPAWIALVGGAVAYAFVRVRAVVRLGLWTQVPYSILVGLAVDVAQMSGYAAGRVHALPALPLDGPARAIRPRRGT